MLTSLANFSVQTNIVDRIRLLLGEHSDLGPHCLLQRQVWNKLAEHIGNDIYVIQVRIQRGGGGTGGPDPPWKITSYMGFYRE